ncbi:hypothetical protein BHE90_001927 [Fusarium euwallaceae]|uniref:ATP-grasp domain-containing protein n=1 Tax=Fusarium euwallaceae TaxID=1147111 RepID=A0A430M650_9HYPO|nr:hypothetical protein BHE90_001927 [Fusarium euwallaceae]
MAPTKYRLTVAFIYDGRADYSTHGYSLNECAELDDDPTIHGITAAFEHLRYRVVLVPGVKALVKHLAADEHKNWDVVFNYSHGLHATSRESQVAALLEEYRIPFTFSDAATLALCSDKAKTKMVLDHYRLPTSPYIVVPRFGNSFDYSEVDKQLSYPLIVKPTSSSSCYGITCANKILGPQALQHEVEKLRPQFMDQEILLENFLSGREFTVALAGTGDDARVLGVSETVWNLHMLRGKDMMPVDFATTQFRRSGGGGKGFFHKHVSLSNPLAEKVAMLGLKAYRALGCRDGARVDIRLTSEEQGSVPCVIEVDPIFGLCPNRSRYNSIAKNNGIEYHELIQMFLDAAMQRHGAMDVTRSESKD